MREHEWRAQIDESLQNASIMIAIRANQSSQRNDGIIGHHSLSECSTIAGIGHHEWRRTNDKQILSVRLCLVHDR